MTRTVDAANGAADVLTGTDRDAQLELLDALLERVELRKSGIALRLRPTTIDRGAGTYDPRIELPVDDERTETVAVELPVQLSRRAAGSRIVLASNEHESGGPDPKLVRLIADAHRWNRMLAEGNVASLRELARRERLDTSDVSRTLHLAYLAPDIVEAIVEGRQPTGLAARRLKRMNELPLDWTAQRRVLGFPA